MNYSVPIEKHLEVEPQIAVVFTHFTDIIDTNYRCGGGRSNAGIGSRDEHALPYRRETHL